MTIKRRDINKTHNKLYMYIVCNCLRSLDVVVTLLYKYSKVYFKELYDWRQLTKYPLYLLRVKYITSSKYICQITAHNIIKNASIQPVYLPHKNHRNEVVKMIYLCLNTSIRVPASIIEMYLIPVLCWNILLPRM